MMMMISMMVMMMKMIIMMINDDKNLSATPTIMDLVLHLDNLSYGEHNCN